MRLGRAPHVVWNQHSLWSQEQEGITLGFCPHWLLCLCTLLVPAASFALQMHSEDKNFKQGYILWHLFCDVARNKPTFKFFKYKESVVADCLLLLKGYAEKASCLAALPGVNDILQVPYFPCECALNIV